MTTYNTVAHNWNISVFGAVMGTYKVWSAKLQMWKTGNV